MQVHEAACFTGTVNFPQAFAIEAFGNLLKSIAANGFKKILGKTKLEYAPKQTVEPLNRFKHLNENGIYNALWWYADYPDNVVGNAGYATEEKGIALMDICVQALARIIKTVKEDTEAPRLQAEFTQRVLNKIAL